MDSIPRKILNVYTVPGKWYCIKYVLFSLLLYFRRVSFFIFFHVYHTTEFNFYICFQIYSYLELIFQPDREQFIKDKNKKLDVAQPLSDHLKVYINFPISVKYIIIIYSIYKK